ncbi:MAG TPA: DHA2 family efflux MFS transporter permease subunit, partial [Candidatus Dormibacteraeota bacterium]|nr:DHA2 family efflux MFS transporter permease subunit [Candidatus Dormibacteraeota bacterium]
GHGGRRGPGRRPAVVATAPPAPEASPPVEDAPVSDRGWVLPLAVLVVGMFMAVLDTDIVNVAIPMMQTQFGATTDQVQWVSTAYTLALGIVVPISGWLGDRYGLDRVYRFALIGFAAGSALCGLAWSLNILIVFRIVQAIGGGLLPAVAQALLYRMVPREKMGSAMGFFGLGVLFAPAVGPTIGGYLVQYVNWRLIFYINIPIAVLGVVAATAVLPRFPRKSGQRFDTAGFATVATSLFSLLLALSEGTSWGWTSYRVLILGAVGLLSLAVFVVVELSVEEPMLDVRIFGNWTYTNASLLMAILIAALFAGMFYVPLFLQQGQGLGALQAGLTLLVPALITGMMMPISGQLYDRIGPRWPATIGLLLMAYGTYLIHGITLATSKGQIVLWMSIRSVGMGLSLMPIITAGMASISSEAAGRASAMNNVIQRVASALGLGVLTAILTSQQAQQMSDRAVLLPSVAPGFPQLQGMAAQGQVGVLQLYNSTSLQVFGTAVGDLFLLTAGLTAVGVLLALMLPTRPVASAEGRSAVLEL